MITRLKVNGFKNLIDVDVQFDFLNFIVGPNAVGKSNLFDFINMIHLHDSESIESSMRKIRSGDMNIQNLFQRINTVVLNSFEYELEVAPCDFIDNNFRNIIQYKGRIQFDKDASNEYPLFTNQEINLSKNKFKWLLDFKELNSGGTLNWHIEEPCPSALYKFQMIDGDIGKPVLYAGFKDLESTFSKEIQSWQIFRIETMNSEIEKSTENSTARRLSADGKNLVAYINSVFTRRKQVFDESEEDFCARLRHRLFECTNEIQDVRFRRPENFVFFQVQDRNNAWHNVSSLSSGTIIFLSLSVIEMDILPGVFLIEEPENGVYPSRLPALLRLLKDISFNPSKPVGPDNPFRQVIVNTHSSILVSLAPEESIIVVMPIHAMSKEKHRYMKPKFFGMRGTWREEAGMPVATISQVMDFLDPVSPRFEDDPLRLIDREDAQQVLERRRKVKVLTSEDA